MHLDDGIEASAEVAEITETFDMPLADPDRRRRRFWFEHPRLARLLRQANDGRDAHDGAAE
jgi:hypothetical protein